MEAWYVFHTRPGCESRAIEALVTRHVTTYVPRIRSGPNGPAALLFPTCLFVYGDPAAAGKARWQYLPGLGELIALGDVLVTVPPKVISWLRAQDGDFTHSTPGAIGCAAADGFVAQLQVGLRAAVSPQDRVDTLLRCLRQVSEAQTPDAATSENIPLEIQHRYHRSTRGRSRKIKSG